MYKKFIAPGKHGRKAKTFEDRKAPAETVNERSFVIRELTREQRLLVGYAGCKGWTEFDWSRFGEGHITGVCPNDGVGPDGRVRARNSRYRIDFAVSRLIDSDPEAEFLATIYLASIGEQL